MVVATKQGSPLQNVEDELEDSFRPGLGVYSAANPEVTGNQRYS